MLYKLILLLMVLGLSGCGTTLFNPNGKIVADYNPKTGELHYESTKSVNINVVRDADGSISLSIESDAASGTKARAAAAKADAEVVTSIIKLIPVLP